MDGKSKVVEHIKLLQLIISRMSSSMLSIKALTLTVLSLLIGFAAKDKISIILIVLYPLLILFMFFDMFYLWQERLFRGLYNKTKDKEDTDFTMDVKEQKETTKFLSCIKSKVIWPFYFTLCIINTIILFVIIK